MKIYNFHESIPKTSPITYNRKKKSKFQTATAALPNVPDTRKSFLHGNNNHKTHTTTPVQHAAPHRGSAAPARRHVCVCNVMVAWWGALGEHGAGPMAARPQFRGRSASRRIPMSHTADISLSFWRVGVSFACMLCFFFEDTVRLCRIACTFHIRFVFHYFFLSFSMCSLICVFFLVRLVHVF